MTAVRDAVIEILERVERGDHAAPLLEARAASLGPLDRNLLRSIVKTTLRHQLRMDHVLARYVERPLPKLDGAVRAALRAGASQLLLLDRIPPHAAVSETVAALGRKSKRATGFVNAVLRAIGRQETPPGKLDLPDGTSTAGRLAVLHSHPRWLVERWVARFGLEVTTKILQADNEDSPVDLLVDPAVSGSRESVLERLRAEGLGVKPSPWAPLAITVSGGNPFSVAAIREGEIAVVDAAAQGLLEMAPRVELALDLAAAPGGKTRTLLAREKARRVVALEPVPSRVRRLAENLERGGRREQVLVLAADGRCPPLPRGGFPLVLLDAPCTGTGTLRKNPEKRYVLKAGELAASAAIQAALLESALDLACRGGMVIYLTCSLEVEENRDVVSATVSRRSDCAIAPIAPESLPEPLRPWVDREGLLTVPPGAENDGFSMAAVRKS